MSNAKMQKADYPEEREDWLMVTEYAKKKSPFGCILCEKTHKAKDCENRAKKAPDTLTVEYKSQYSYYGD